MSSHLSVSYTASNGATVTKSLGQAQDTASNAAEGILGMFAALLNQNGDSTADTSQSSKSTAEIKLAGLIGLSLKTGSGDQTVTTDDKKTTTDPSVDPSTVVVPVAAVTPLQQPLAALVETLTALGDSLAKGEAPAPALLEKLNQQLDTLAQSLGVPAPTTPSFDDLLALATSPLPANASVDQHLNQKFAELAQNLLTTAPQQPATTELSQKVSAKLAALAKSLDDGTIGADTLAKLGLTSSAPNKDPALESAIARLLGVASVKAADTQTAPSLAAPTLSPTEAGLTATAGTKPAPAATTSDTSLTPTISTAPAAATADASADGSDPKKHSDDKKSDVPDIAAVVATKSEATDKDTSKAGANQLGVQNASRVEAPATARVPTTAYQTNQQQINLPQIAFEMVRQVQHGNSRFQIRLDPPELGRIDVRLDIDKGGTVNARLFVEKSETLDLMQRDQRALHQALQQAGLDSSKTNLEFSLRQNNSGQHHQQAQGGNEQLPNFGDAIAEETPPPTVKLYRGGLSASGLNIIA